VIPIFKLGADNLFSNYRPISVLPVFSKILERVVYERLLNYLNKYNILLNNQYGFRKNHSTSLALIHLLDTITTAFDEKNIQLEYFLIYLRLLIPSIMRYFLRNLRIMVFEDRPFNGSKVILLIDNSMLNSTVLVLH
jgi:potassium voltage-gated channel Eag-related subfamily H protein 8